jgi:1,4-dihydroxy-2-naphthoate octaprenyltransferase
MLFRLVRPINLALAALAYSFGASLADYLGKPFIASSFWLGLFIVLLVQVVMSLLAQVFRLDAEPLQEGETRPMRQVLRNNVLYTSLACIIVIALSAYALFATDRLPFSSFFFLLLSILLVVTFAVPPMRLENRGMGEFILAVQLAYVSPSFAFTLQSYETHRFLALAIPLALLAFACFTAGNFETFAQDKKLQRGTLLTRLGWQRVAPLHNITLALAYLMFFSSSAFGLSFSLIWPAFLTLPFAVLQIAQLRNLTLGAKPNWTLLRATALAVFALTTYFLTATFWIR